jgi:predicted RNA-binding Zn ribbon-like protein
MSSVVITRRGLRHPATRGGGRPTPGGFLFELTGGHAALDLTNTLDLRRTGAPKELLPTYDDLVSWSVQAGTLVASEAVALRLAAKRRPRAARAVLGRARVLREALFEVFNAVATDAPLPKAALGIVNDALPSALGHLRLVADQGGLAWDWSDDPALDRMLWPILRGAATLLTSAEAGRIRQCEGQTCAWLFLDVSKNGSRRWCDMAVCGNRSKVRRFREAQRADG